MSESYLLTVLGYIFIIYVLFFISSAYIFTDMSGQLRPRSFRKHDVQPLILDKQPVSASGVPSPGMRNEAKIHVIRTDKTVAELRDLTVGLFTVAKDAVGDYFCPRPGQKCYISVLLLDSHWDTSTQFQDTGIGFICTTHDKLHHYLSAVTAQRPIESRFSSKMVDSLNAEIALGTVTSVAEGVQWLGYSYLFIRMRREPRNYGIEWAEVQDDPMLVHRRRQLIIQATSNSEIMNPKN